MLAVTSTSILKVKQKLGITFKIFQKILSAIRKSGWPSGLRRQTQELFSSLLWSEHSGPRMRAWVRIPLLTQTFCFSCKITEFSNAQASFWTYSYFQSNIYLCNELSYPMNSFNDIWFFIIFFTLILITIAYIATSTELHGVKINEFFYPNFI